jgi:uncharacterized protein YjbI with pentapeptide repeats
LERTGASLFVFVWVDLLPLNRNVSHSKAGLKTNFEGLVLALIPILFSLLSAFLAISSSWFLASYFIPETQVEGRIFGAFLFLSYLIFLLITGLKKFSSGIIFLVGIASMALFFVLVKNGFLLAISFTPFFNSIQVAASVIAGGIFLILSFVLGSYGNYFLWSYVFINIALFSRLFFDLSQEIFPYERSVFEHNIETYLQKFLITFILSFSLAFIYRSITRRLLKENSEFSKLLRDAGKLFWASRGTSFVEADLTDVNFHSADLLSADLRGAILTRACWTDAKNLLGIEFIQHQKVIRERVRTEGTILADLDVREVLVTADGKGRKLCGKNLKGAYLVNADLTESDLSEADFSEANLEGSNLERANLTKTQVLGTNFRGAKFTGVSGLKSWNRDSNTVLEEIDCMYVYLNTPEQGRYPDNRDLETGEFTKIFQEVENTTELIFRDGIDWKAFAFSFNEANTKIYNEFGQEIYLKKYEILGDGFIRLEVIVPPGIDRNEFGNDFSNSYQFQLEVARLQEKLEGKNEVVESYKEQNRSLLRLLEKPNITYNTQTGDRSVVNHEAGDTYNVDQAGSVGKYARSDHNTFVRSEQKQNLAEAAAEIKQLLDQLAQTYPNRTESIVVNAIQTEVKRNPTLKARLINALKTGGVEALKTVFNHPLVSVPVETIKGFLEVEAE